ncbi:hypothetical protein A3739_27865 [Oleiphilus sp. HI0067]|nr:hypothetical protein A3738_10025 [Oleiphilus sp. HI0066]KZY67811.1 hypothetical protein A3739_11895 [Oleiphilus sp. HI0067]KZY72172.1 hypothetical protein A3739_27865 [Oleiphilus sp. HI0067]
MAIAKPFCLASKLADKIPQMAALISTKNEKRTLVFHSQIDKSRPWRLFILDACVKREMPDFDLY